MMPLIRRARTMARAGLLTLAASCAGRSDARGVDTESGPAAAARAVFLRDVDSLEARIARLERAATSTSDLQVLRARFSDARTAYKRLEHFATYYHPSTARLMNGPALPRVEEDEGPDVVFPPEGFQVIEEMLSGDERVDRAAVAGEAAAMLELVTRMRRSAVGTPFTDDRVFDAARLQLARIATLGLAGFDSPVALGSLSESAVSLRGIRDAVRPFADMDSAFDVTAVVLDLARGYDEFDRAGFLLRSLNPLGRALRETQLGLGIPFVVERRALITSAATPFDAGAYDVLAFAPHGTSAPSPRTVALGARLFFDPSLSGDGSRSCATCHMPSRAFTDGLARSVPFDPSKGQSLRNAPTVVNVALQSGSFADLRATYLEDQITEVVGSPVEMHGAIADRLRFALAAYLRTLVALNAPFDRYMRGDTAAMDASQVRGFNVFMGKGKCGTCHFAPLFNGTVPPMYTDTDVEVIGVPDRPTRAGARVDPDSGRHRITRSAPHLHAFKTPGIRNVALTAPYMHNGVFRTLAEVIDFYDVGGGAGWGFALENQTLPPDSLRLTKREKVDLEAFLRALTDTAGLLRQP